MTRTMKIASLGVVAVLVAVLAVWKLTGNSTKTNDGVQATSGKAANGSRVNAARSPAARRASLKGTISAKGAPLAATVLLTPTSSDEFASPLLASAGADGGYSFTDVAPGSYRVSASVPRYLPATSAEISLAAGDSETVDLELVGGGGDVGGEITDITGGPIAMAQVRLTPVAGILEARRDRAFATLTDASGRFATTAADGVYVLSAHHPDYVPGSRRIEIRDGNRELSLALVPGAAVEGVVRYAATGEPAAGAEVLYRRETIARGFGGGMRELRDAGRVRADDRGAFRITGAGAGTLTLVATSEGARTRDEVVVPLGIAESVSGVELFLESAFYISGRVVDKKSEPIAGRDVFADNGETQMSATSAADGSFRAGPLAAGRYTVAADTRRRMSIAQRGVEVTITDADVSGIEVVGDDGQAMIRGRVEPATDADVSIAWDKPDSMMTLASPSRTEDDGSFEIGPVTPDEKIALRAVSADGRLGSIEVAVPASGKDGVVIALREAASITGRVVDKSKKPVGGVVVGLSVKAARTRRVLVNGSEVSARRGVTSPEGVFSIPALEAGTYQVRLTDDRGQSLEVERIDGGRASGPGAPPLLTIADSEQKKGVEIAVDVASEEIRGRVVDSSGKPVEDAFVTASKTFEFRSMAPRERGAGDGPEPARERDRSADDEPEERSEMMMVVATDEGSLGGGGLAAGFAPVVTDADGRFAVSGLRAGKYDLVAEGQRGSARGFASGVETSSDVTLPILPLTRLDGEVTLSGAPVSNFRVELSGPTRVSQPFRDAKGAFTIRRLDPGAYDLSVTGEGGEARTTVTVEPGKPTNVKVQLERQLRVTGRLVDAAGAPVVGALILLTPRRDDGEVEIRVTGSDMPEPTDESGAFAVTTLPGSFSLLALDPQKGPVAMKPIDVDVTGTDLDLGTIVADGKKPPPP